MTSLITACRMFGLDRFSGRTNQFDRFGRMGSFHPGFMVVGLLIAIAVVVGIFFLVRALVRSSRNHNNTMSVPMTPEVKPTVGAINAQALQILDERLARGEIDTEEYRRRKDELSRP